jgi:hypothetical protein
MVLSQMSAGKNVRNQVIEILGSEFPLSAKQIFNRVKKQGISGTYHGVYDCVQEMVRTGVINKEGVEYSLSGKWITSTCVIMERIQIKHTLGKIDNTTEKSGIKTMVFDSYSDYVKFVRKYDKYFIENVDSNKNNKICWLAYHASRPILNAEQNVEFAKKLKKKNIDFSIAICGNTKLDKISKTVFESCGLNKVVLDVLNRFGMSIAIYNDVAICSIFNDKFTQERNKIYRESDKNQENSHEISRSISKVANFINSVNTSVTVMIVKNPDVVNLYRNYILSFFDSEDNSRSESF